MEVLNRETALVLAWLEEDAGRWARIAACAARGGGMAPDAAVDELTELMRGEVETQLPRLQGIAAELLGRALWRVDFDMLAVELLREARPPLHLPAQFTRPRIRPFAATATPSSPRRVSGR